MGFRIEIRSDGFQGNVLKTIPLKPGDDDIQLVAIPTESMQPKTDGKGKVIEAERFAKEPNLRLARRDYPVVDGVIRVVEDPKDKKPVVHLVKMIKTRNFSPPKSLGNNTVMIAKGGEHEEIVGTYKDSGSLGEIRIFVAAKVGEMKIDEELPAVIVSDAQKTVYVKGHIDLAASKPLSHQWRFSSQNHSGKRP